MMCAHLITNENHKRLQKPNKLKKQFIALVLLSQGRLKQVEQEMKRKIIKEKKHIMR